MVKIVLKIDGMMCNMCESHVNDVIRKIVPDAKKVKSSHKTGESTFISNNQPEENQIVAAIVETGYTVLSMNVEPYKKRFLF